MGEQMQLSDGRWVPVAPVPFFKDTRPWYVRLWHVLLFWEDEDELAEPWLVPMERPEGPWPRG